MNVITTNTGEPIAVEVHGTRYGLTALFGAAATAGRLSAALSTIAAGNIHDASTFARAVLAGTDVETAWQADAADTTRSAGEQHRAALVQQVVTAAVRWRTADNAWNCIISDLEASVETAEADEADQEVRDAEDGLAAAVDAYREVVNA